MVTSCCKIFPQESATLYHCDLSYCCLDSASCALLGEGLRDNHSLYGLHVVGVSAAFCGNFARFCKMLDVSLPQLVCSRPSGIFSELC